MYYGLSSYYTPGIGANAFTKLAQKVTAAAKKVKANIKATTKFIKKGKAIYKQYVRPDGTIQEVPATQSEIATLSQVPASGFTLGSVGKYLPLVLLGGAAIYVFRRRTR